MGNLTPEMIVDIEELSQRLPPVRLKNLVKLGTVDNPKYFLIDSDDYKGGGKYGLVFGARLIDIQQQQIGHEPFVVKIMGRDRSTKKQVLEEYRRQSPYIKSEPPALIGEEFYLFMEDLGTGLTYFLKEHLSSLTLDQRLHLITSYLHTFNLWAHHTISTGHAIQNLDVKIDNMVVRPVSVPEGSQVYYEVFPIDYGFAEEVRENNPDAKRQVNRPSGTPIYTSPEIFDSEGGVRSDIFSMVPFIATILGAEPLKILDNIHPSLIVKGREERDERTKFNLDNLLEDLIPADFELRARLINVVKQFLNNMQNFDFDKRPNANDLIKFFFDFSNLIKLHQFMIEVDEGSEDYREDLTVRLSNMKRLAENYTRPTLAVLNEYRDGLLNKPFLFGESRRHKSCTEVYISFLTKTESLIQTNALLYSLLSNVQNRLLIRRICEALHVTNQEDGLRKLKHSLIEEVGETAFNSEILEFVHRFGQEANCKDSKPSTSSLTTLLDKLNHLNPLQNSINNRLI